MAKVGDKDIENKVFETTKELLLKYGIKGWNMDDLSERCGMSKRTLYKIIGNKEELLFKCNLDNINNNIAEVEKFFNSDKSYEELLNDFSNTLINLFDDFIITTSDPLRKEYPRIAEMIKNRKVRLKELNIEFMW